MLGMLVYFAVSQLIFNGWDGTSTYKSTYVWILHTLYWMLLEFEVVDVVLHDKVSDALKYWKDSYGVVYKKKTFSLYVKYV